MREGVTQWTEVALERGLRLAGIFLLAIVLNRLLKALTNRLVKLATSEARAAS
jgi:hypothetical protein